MRSRNLGILGAFFVAAAFVFVALMIFGFF